MKKIFALMAATFLAVSVYAGEFADISIPDVKAASDAKSAVIIDANSSDSYKAGHVPGALSWAAPTAGCNTAVIVPGTTVHSWQATAATGMSIGLKGMLLASKTLALSAVDLYTHPDILVKAHAEFEERRGPDFKYRPLLGDRSPPLDYRN